MPRVLLFGIVLLLAGCGGLTSTPGRFGEVTSAVVLVNPTINPGSTDPGVVSGSERDGVAVRIGAAGPVNTEAADPALGGLALLEGFGVGTQDIFLNGESHASLGVMQEKELYDVALALQDDGTFQHIFEPVRYQIGGDINWVTNKTELLSALRTPNSVVLLAPGVYEVDLTISETGILIFGSWDPEKGPLSIIRGDVSVNGSVSRMRGLEIEGNLHVSNSDFSMAFSKVASADISGNQVFLLRNEFTTGPVSVPGQNTILVDNTGL